MFLKSLELNGFKSFPDKTRIIFQEGITSLLGPNGCGKSNIVDSIKWVLGEQSTKTLRAGRMEDVIFSGTETRKPSSMAEVTLVLDNEEHLLASDVPEISIKRRLFRSGESEYYMNGQRCLLKNIRELFMDTGVGKSSYSILEQGKIDQILSNKPEDRRYIFDEAAGISRYKAKCTEAQQRIDKSEENITQVMTVINEVKKVYDRTRMQAVKAEKWQELKDKAFYLDTDMKLIRVDTLLKLKELRTNTKNEAIEKEKVLKERLGEYDGIILSKSGALRDLQDKIKSLEVNIGKGEVLIESINDTIAAYDESYSEYLDKASEYENKLQSIDSEIKQTQNELDLANSQKDELLDRLEEKESQLEYTEKKLQDTRQDIIALDKEIAETEENNNNLDNELRSLSEALKSVIESLIKEVDEKTATEYSASRRDKAESEFIQQIKSLLSLVDNKLSFISTLPSGLDYSKELATKDYETIKISLAKIEELFIKYKDSIPPVIDTILSPEGLVSKKREIEEKEEGARKAIFANRSKIEGAKIKRESKENDTESLMLTLSGTKEIIASLKANISNQDEKVKRLSSLLLQKENEVEDARLNSENAKRRVHDINDKIKAKESEKQTKEEEIKSFKSQLKDANSDLSMRMLDLDHTREEKEETSNSYLKAQSDITTMDMYIESTENNIKEIYSQYFDTYAHALNEYAPRLKDITCDEEVLKEELDKTNNEIKALGNINHLAKDEFDQAEDQYKFYTKQLDDLEKAKSDLVGVLSEILDKSRQMFLDTYKEISDNFRAMFTRLFGGGNAYLELSNPEDSLQSGIEIFAQPPGKSMKPLSLLSGGERSMTAVALLFATYQVKPSPFCILDEIDAALDDRNIGYFLDVLQDFAQKSQFIIITHNTHTVTGGDSMLGVSQMEAGVSTAVSYRVASVKGQPRILNDEGEEVVFNSEGVKQD